MKDRKITHEVKLQKSVIIILSIIAFGILANAFNSNFKIKSAFAESLSGYLNVYIKECKGCR